MGSGVCVASLDGGRIGPGLGRSFSTAGEVITQPVAIPALISSPSS